MREERPKDYFTTSWTTIIDVTRTYVQNAYVTKRKRNENTKPLFSPTTSYLPNLSISPLFESVYYFSKNLCQSCNATVLITPKLTYYIAIISNQFDVFEERAKKKALSQAKKPSANKAFGLFAEIAVVRVLPPTRRRASKAHVAIPTKEGST